MGKVLVIASEKPSWLKMIREHGHTWLLMSTRIGLASPLCQPDVIIVDVDTSGPYPGTSDRFRGTPVIHVSNYRREADSELEPHAMWLQLSSSIDLVLMLKAVDMLIEKHRPLAAAHSGPNLRAILS